MVSKRRSQEDEQKGESARGEGLSGLEDLLADDEGIRTGTGTER